MTDSTGVAIATTHPILIVINVVGNSFVCVIIKKYRDMRVPMNFLLVNLAISDILYATFGLPDIILILMPTHPEGMIGTLLCKGYLIAWIGAASSIFTLVIIAFERYYAVIYPLSSKGRLTKRKLKVIIAGCWTVSAVLILPLFLVINVKGNYCVLFWTKKWMSTAYGWVWFALVVLSVTLMAGLYIRVVYTLWLKGNDDIRLTHQQKGVLKMRKRVTLMVTTVTTLFGICWLTDTIAHVVIHYNDHKVAFTVIHTVILLNSAINPFVYALINQNFREKMKEIICCTGSAAVRDIAARELQAFEFANKILPTAEQTDARIVERNFKQLLNTTVMKGTPSYVVK